MKNILIIDNSPGITGALKCVVYVARRLRDEFNFHFALPPGNGEAVRLLQQEGFPLFTLQFVELSKSWKVLIYFPVLLFNTFRLLHYCRTNAIHLVHVNDLYNMTGVMLKLLWKKIRLIYHVRLLPASYAGSVYWLWLRAIRHTATKVAAVSESVSRELKGRVDNDKLVTIYDFIALSERYPDEKPSGMPVRFLYLANFTPGKGHDLAIEAFRQALALHPHISLTLAGSDFGKIKNKKYKMALRKQAAALPENKEITWLELVEDVELLYKQHDVILNFSWSESFSLTCYEAAYYGRAVIATRSGGPEELVIHGETGFLVEPGNIGQMAHYMVMLAGRDALRRQMGEHARQAIRKRMTGYDTVNQYRRLYGG